MKKLLPGAVISEAGSTVSNETGSWRSVRPVIDYEKCINCMMCWLYCPEPAISNEKPPKIDYRYCKGCGICANECPVKVIKMVEEGLR
jgi:2-oxoacid:acceptor oxidoreductase delta subunit (pyruvate/2-ketoisovalerate family)